MPSPEVIAKTYETIKANPGLRCRAVTALVGGCYRAVEDAIWELYASCKIQIEADSTMRVVRDGEKVFRHDT